MSPFDLPGPQFLGFYAVISGAILLAAYLARRVSEAYPLTETGIQGMAGDPYALAYLRGGRQHLLAVTVLSLLDRKLLTAQGDRLIATSGLDAVEIAERPLEQAILRACQAPMPMSRLLLDSNIILVIEHLESSLRGKGLIPDEQETMRRAVVFGVALLCLSGISLAKIFIALQRGHHNIIFLILLTLVAIVLAHKVLMRRRTVAGDSLFQRMETRFANLKIRAKTLALGGASHELAFVAALFGFAVLPIGMRETLKPLHVGQYAPADGGSPYSGGSSCGSGGSSCGGGGCGGGCGGCG